MKKNHLVCVSLIDLHALFHFLVRARGLRVVADIGAGAICVCEFVCICVRLCVCVYVCVHTSVQTRGMHIYTIHLQSGPPSICYVIWDASLLGRSGA